MNYEFNAILIKTQQSISWKWVASSNIYLENQVPNADKILLVKKEEEQGGLLTLLNIESQYKTLQTNILGYLGRERPLDQ